MTPVLLTPAHIPAVAALEKSVFATPWSEKSLEMLCAPENFGVVVTKGDRVLGYAGMQTVLDEGSVTNVATHPDVRGRGIGTALMQALLDEARRRLVASVFLEVRVSNAPAIALYKKFGFALIGERKRFYTNPIEDALVMRLDLGAEH